MTILVTGAIGFIGSNLCHMLVEMGYEVIGVDNFSVGSNTKNVKGLAKTDKFFLYREDICQDVIIEGIFHDHPITHVVHLAAQSHVDRSIEGDQPFWQTNVCGTASLMRAAVESGNVVRFINQITDEVYGSRKSPAFEGTGFAPTSPYAASKAAQYYVGKSYWRTYGLPVVSTFPSNTYGPRQWPEKLIPKFILRLLRGQKVPLMKSSTNERDWLSVEDHCRALVNLLFYNEPGKKDIAGMDFNIGASSHKTNMEITQKILQYLELDEDMIETVPDRLAHDTRYDVDWGKINFYTGWTPKTDFDKYLQSTIEWYKEHQDWYSGVEL